jgi:hypothetical protein
LTKLKYNESPSNFAYDFNLRCYNTAIVRMILERAPRTAVDHVVGPGRKGSPRVWIPFYSRSEGSKHVSMTWRAWAWAPC